MSVTESNDNIGTPTCVGQTMDRPVGGSWSWVLNTSRSSPLIEETYRPTSLKVLLRIRKDHVRLKTQRGHQEEVRRRGEAEVTTVRDIHGSLTSGYRIV